jgi:FkbM family methyltransferase
MWEPCLTCWILEQLAPGDVFIDVGANIGYYSLLASKLVGEFGLVVAIEPSPTIFNSLKNNLALNRVGNIRLVNMAVSDQLQVLRLFIGPEWNVGLTTTVEKSSFKFEGQVLAAPLWLRLIQST